MVYIHLICIVWFSIHLRFFIHYLIVIKLIHILAGQSFPHITNIGLELLSNIFSV